MRRKGEEEEDDERCRRSKDKKINAENRIMLKILGELEWFILNGDIEGDLNEEWTYTGEREELVIDYVIVKVNARERG